MATSHSYPHTYSNAEGSAQTGFWTRPAVTWTVRGLVALGVLFAGAGKLFASNDMLDDTWFAPLFMRFIGSCEILAAFGLILPGLLRTQRWLTPLAALGLVIIMTGATATELTMQHWSSWPMPFVLGLMAAFVAWAVPFDGAPWLTSRSEDPKQSARPLAL